MKFFWERSYSARERCSGMPKEEGAKQRPSFHPISLLWIPLDDPTQQQISSSTLLDRQPPPLCLFRHNHCGTKSLLYSKSLSFYFGMCFKCRRPEGPLNEVWSNVQDLKEHWTRYGRNVTHMANSVSLCQKVTTYTGPCKESIAFSYHWGLQGRIPPMNECSLSTMLLSTAAVEMQKEQIINRKKPCMKPVYPPIIVCISPSDHHSPLRNLWVEANPCKFSKPRCSSRHEQDRSWSAQCQSPILLRTSMLKTSHQGKERGKKERVLLNICFPEALSRFIPRPNFSRSGCRKVI